MSNILSLPRIHSQPGAKLYTRLSGTSTPQPVYTDIGLTVEHSNPIVADGDGYFKTGGAYVIYMDPALPNYRLIHTDGSNVDDDYTMEVLLEPILDDIPSSSNVSSTYRVKGTNPTIYWQETDASSNNRMWRMRVNAEVMTIDAGDDAESTWVSVFSVGRVNSFVGALTGMDGSGSVPVTVTFQKFGGFVYLSVPTGATGTSASDQLTLTGIPAALQPVHTVYDMSPVVQDNGNTRIGQSAIVGGSGTIIFALFSAITTNPSATAFTASGAKGLGGGWRMVYSVD